MFAQKTVIDSAGPRSATTTCHFWSVGSSFGTSPFSATGDPQPIQAQGVPACAGAQNFHYLHKLKLIEGFLANWHTKHCPSSTHILRTRVQNVNRKSLFFNTL